MIFHLIGGNPFPGLLVLAVGDVHGEHRHDRDIWQVGHTD